MLEDLPIFDLVLFWWICLTGVLWFVISGTLRAICVKIKSKLKRNKDTKEPVKVD